VSRKRKPLKKLTNTELITKYAALVGHNFERVRFMACPNQDKGVQLEILCRREILRRMDVREPPSRS
jgi:hypothetical protein